MTPTTPTTPSASTPCSCSNSGTASPPNANSLLTPCPPSHGFLESRHLCFLPKTAWVPCDSTRQILSLRVFSFFVSLAQCVIYNRMDVHRCDGIVAFSAEDSAG